MKYAVPDDAEGDQPPGDWLEDRFEPFLENDKDPEDMVLALPGAPQSLHTTPAMPSSDWGLVQYQPTESDPAKHTRSWVSSLMNSEAFRRHLRAKNQDARAVRDAQQCIDAWKQLRAADPAAFRALVNGMHVQDYDSQPCPQLATLFVNVLWTAAVMVAIDVLSQHPVYQHGPGLLVCLVAVPVLFGVLLNVAAWRWGGSYLRCTASDERVQAPVPIVRLLASFVLDAVVVQYTCGLGMFVNLVRPVLFSDRATTGQWVCGLARWLEIESTRRAE